MCIRDSNTIVPVSRQETYYPMEESQAGIEVQIYQGESRLVRDNILLGVLHVPLPRQSRYESAVNVRFTYDAVSYTHLSNTIIDGVARVDAGSLNVQAGRDVNARAAAIAATGDASIRAGNDINLTAVGTSYGESFNFGKKNRSEMRTTEDVGTRIAAAGNLTLMAAQDINCLLYTSRHKIREKAGIN